MINKTLMLILQYGLHVFEISACVAGFLSWKKIRNSYWKWFAIYLAVIVAVEIVGFITQHNRPVNTAVFNYFGIPVQFFFLAWLFHLYFAETRKSWWPLIGAVIYLGAWVVDIFTDKAPTWFTSFSYTVGNITLLVTIIIFFLRFIHSDEILNYRHSMMFLVSLGLLVFYLGTFPYYALRNTIYYKSRPLFYIYWAISLLLDWLMYIFFCIAFIWGRPK